MEFIHGLLDYVVHLDEHLNILVENYGTLTYLILFLIIFAETGLVVTPFLPGDSLLFAIGALAAQGSLNVVTIAVLLIVAAIVGDSVNYAVGKFVGPKVFSQKDSKIFKKEYLEKTQYFYDKYGAKTIIFARFVPLVRTFAPFVAGVGSMHYGKFIFYNVIGGIVWVVLFVFAGYFFGNIEFVKENFEWVILGIIFVSLIPPIMEFWKHKRAK